MENDDKINVVAIHDVKQEEGIISIIVDINDGTDEPSQLRMTRDTAADLLLKLSAQNLFCDHV